MSVKASLMDPEFGYCRVTGAADETEALAAARAKWPEVETSDYWLIEDHPMFVVESSGWYRCQPCVCGLGHRYDVFPTEPNARGASFTYMIGLETPR